MSAPSTSDRPGGERGGGGPLAAPPQFGVKDLQPSDAWPPLTVMGDVLQREPHELPAVELSTHVRSSMTEPARSRRWVWLVLGLLGLLGAGAWLAFTLTTGAGEPADEMASAGVLGGEAAQRGVMGGQAREVLDARRDKRPLLERLASANDSAWVLAASYDERQALLADLEEAGLIADVRLAPHIARNLVQAGDAADPCGAFAAALTEIEVAHDREPYTEALRSVSEPPVGHDGQVCAGLGDRLAALTAAAASPPTTREAQAKPRRRAARSRRRSRRRAPAKKPATPTPPPDPTPAAADEPGKDGPIASPLEDGLHGLEK